MNYYFITGTSKGIGLSLAKQLIKEGNFLYLVSRTINQELVELAKQQKVKVVYKSYDLSDVESLESLIKDFYSQIDIELVNGVYLINNAGMLDPINSIEHVLPHEIVKHMNVNLVAPMILQSSFIRESINKLNKLTQVRVLNISSGAALRPFQGWSVYCSSKAGLNMFTQGTVKDLEAIESQIKVVAVAPGIVDTSMQAMIRNATETEFELVEQFKEYKEQGQLLEPQFVGERLVKLIHSPSFGDNVIMRINEIE